MIEVELKFPVADTDMLRARLVERGAQHVSTQRHVDHYFNHPCRDFADTGEALRIRIVDGQPFVTYKGAKLPGKVKARRELEWPLDQGANHRGANHLGDDRHETDGDPDGAKMRELLLLLGFREVATVVKHRENYTLPDESGLIAITIDSVEELGTFAEVEVIATDESQVESTRQRVINLSQSLDLGVSEPSSYLRLLLAQRDVAP